MIRVPAVLNSREAAPDPAGRGRGWGFQPVSSHLPRTSLLPAAPQVTAWHQHTKTSIPSASGRKKATFSPLVPQGRWSLDYTCSFSTHKNYATCTPHTERYGVCVHLLVSRTHTCSDTDTAGEGPVRQGFHRHYVTPQVEQVLPGSNLLSSNWPTASPQQNKGVERQVPMELADPEGWRV